MSPMKAMQQAIAEYSHGDLDAAKRSCLKVLTRESEHFDALSMLGVIAARTNFLEAAADFLGRAVAVRPHDATAHNNYGIAQKNLDRLDDALASFARALEINPIFAEAQYNQGNALERQRRLEEALDCYDRALQINPNYADAHNNQGKTRQALGHTARALESYNSAIACRPAFAEAHYNRGVALLELHRTNEALAAFDSALRAQPRFVAAHAARGDSLRALGHLEHALQSYQQALAISPEWAVAHNNLGVLLQDLGRHEQALKSLDQALQLQPKYADAHNNRGNILKTLGRNAEALQSYERALAIRPQSALTLNNRGVLLQELDRLEESLASLESALALRPQYADALFNRGNTLAKLKDFARALDSYNFAIAIRADHAEALNNRANVLMELLRCEEALRGYDQALEIRPDYPEAWFGRGNALKELKRTEEALQSQARALTIRPDYDWLYGNLLHTKMQLCDWSNFDTQLAELVSRVEQRQSAAPPFAVLALLDSPRVQRLAAEIWATREHSSNPGLPPIGRHGRPGKIRVGYFSRDFRNHPVSMLLAETLERHNRESFEIYAFSYGPETRDEMRQRIEQAVDRFVDVRNLRDIDVVSLAREMGLDIAVDLAGYTGGRTGLFALRLAPIQVSYLGYLGTLGARFMDYLIADETIVPTSHKIHYTERIAYLPCYQANASNTSISDRQFSREELGLAPAGFVFCCFNASYKLAPQTFDRWTRILHRVKGSQLLLLSESAEVERNLKIEADRRGIDANRLVFGGKLPVPEYLARFRSADLFLDTLPYNAGTTASNALWAGLPVLTRIGESFAGRVAASLLNALELPELIAETDEQYESTAVALASDLTQLHAIQQRLRQKLRTTLLFNTPVFTQHLEESFRQMHRRWQAGLAPDDIHVSP